MKRGKAPLIYRRENRRYYIDLRAYRDVLAGRTGRHMALVAAGEKLATKDRSVAVKLAAKMISELEAKRRSRVLLGDVRETALSDFAGEFLVLKKKDGRVSDDLLEWAERVALPRAIAFFGASKKLQNISVTDVREWSEWLSLQIGARKTRLSPQTVRHHLNLLSNLFRYAQQEAVVPGGHNPVAQLVSKPVGTRREARWLQVDEATRLLQAARKNSEASGSNGDLQYPLLATLLLTGGRKSEVLGLELRDVDFDRMTVRIRPNMWRTLKTRTSDRTVPLWPQLASILEPHIRGREADRKRTTDLLFATIGANGGETMILDFRKALERTARSAGFAEKSITAKVFRHTYCAARLQTLDHGAPVSPFTVARELGHGGDSMVKAVYGHLGTVRHRSPVVEYVPPLDLAKYPAIAASLLPALMGELGTSFGTMPKANPSFSGAQLP